VGISSENGYLKAMKLRPFAWFIIVANAYFIISFFIDYDPNGDDLGNGIGIMVLFFWLALMNTVLYVIFRITAGRRSDEPKSIESKLKEIERLKESGIITEDEYLTTRKAILESN
jgi:hypothetical protein